MLLLTDATVCHAADARQQQNKIVNGELDNDVWMMPVQQGVALTERNTTGPPSRAAAGELRCAAVECYRRGRQTPESKTILAPILCRRASKSTHLLSMLQGCVVVVVISHESVSIIALWAVFIHRNAVDSSTTSTS